MIPESPDIESITLTTIAPIKVDRDVREYHLNSCSMRPYSDANAAAKLLESHPVTRLHPIKARSWG